MHCFKRSKITFTQKSCGVDIIDITGYPSLDEKRTVRPIKMHKISLMMSLDQGDLIDKTLENSPRSRNTLWRKQNLHYVVSLIEL